MLYVVIAEWGEYEDFTQEVRGVFSSREKALSAISEMASLSRETYARFKAAEQKRRQWLADNCEPARVHDGRPYYRQEDYVAAEAAVPRPNFRLHEGGVAYRILEARLDGNHPSEAPKEVWASEAEDAA